MPIPTPKPDESRQDFMKRCMEAIGGEFEDNDQAVAICMDTWRRSRKVEDQIEEWVQKNVQERTESEVNTEEKSSLEE